MAYCLGGGDKKWQGIEQQGIEAGPRSKTKPGFHINLPTSKNGVNHKLQTNVFPTCLIKTYSQYILNTFLFFICIIRKYNEEYISLSVFDIQPYLLFSSVLCNSAKKTLVISCFDMHTCPIVSVHLITKRYHNPASQENNYSSRERD